MTPIPPRATVRLAGHPLHHALVHFPIALFTFALGTDIAYALTADMMWADFSAWLLAIGLLMGVLAFFAAAIDFIASRAVRAQRPAFPHLLGTILVLVLAAFDNLVHSRDGWTSVVPGGLILSAVLFVTMLLTAWLGSEMVYRHGVGVYYPEQLP